MPCELPSGTFAAVETVSDPHPALYQIQKFARDLNRDHATGQHTYLDITIEKLIYGGEGLAHHDGSTVFVPFVLPAERVAVEAVEQKKKFVRGRVERILQAAPERVDGALPAFRGLRRVRLPAHSLRGAAEIQERDFARNIAADWEDRVGRGNHDARIAAVGLSQPRAVESAAAGKSGRRRRSVRNWRGRRGEAGHRIFSREFDGAVRGGRLLDYFAAAAEDFAFVARGAGGRRFAAGIAGNRSVCGCGGREAAC